MVAVAVAFGWLTAAQDGDGGQREDQEHAGAAYARAVATACLGHVVASRGRGRPCEGVPVARRSWPWWLGWSANIYLRAPGA
jgi:hypothetical protein